GPPPALLAALGCSVLQGRGELRDKPPRTRSRLRPETIPGPAAQRYAPGEHPHLRDSPKGPAR
ncbi:hypothetical protein ABZ322_12150, partial [Streptomyces sp. NPDC006129]|uniref:hypothetical protein n=1 Tax=Streptomyces sp. NPDC006129 TaxID=3155348 RepID=UPI0033BB6C90